MSEPVIVLNGLTKRYGKFRGVEDLTFAVEQGETFGFIGPNGAGKSTTICTLMGLLKPTGGSASIFGLDCNRNASAIAKDVGYLPGENCCYNNLKVKDMLQYTADLYGVDCRGRMKELRESGYKKITLAAKAPIPEGFFAIPGAANVRQEDRAASLMFNGSAASIMDRLCRLELEDILIEEPSLEEIFLHYYA